MKTIFKDQFLKQIEKLKDKKLKRDVKRIILQVESCSSLLEIQNLKKLTGYKHFYRIRTGDYRIGIKSEEGTVIFTAFDHRKDIYKHFP